uniref:Uncharacterized protein n=1 Tax=Arundo donax TaxID=35708 RepID=A0A0A9E4J1_ARUDO
MNEVSQSTTSRRDRHLRVNAARPPSTPPQLCALRKSSETT